MFDQEKTIQSARSTILAVVIFTLINIFAIAFAEYYFFLPGAITAPRYQLPALPCLCTMAGLWLAALPDHLKEAAKWRRERYRSTPAADPESRADKV